MPKLNKRELRLAIAFGTILFVAGNIVLFDFFRKTRLSQEKRLAELESEKMVSDLEMEDRDYWIARHDWLRQKQPLAGTSSTQGAALLSEIREIALKNQVEIISPSILEPSASPYYYEVSIKITLEGPIENLTRCLAQIQDPESFQAISRFTMKSAPESKVKADLTISKWYAPRNSS